ncbi:DUF3857 domain-containing protein [Pelomonas sp. CA6]|uniref:DUF3857 domain-containing protein n=1 Tax=Pelomonas sp. CA6 TaxID=2907999 RepID=UPI001F4BDEB7|nr:DUF3857 domain-containing protein [Pelomonas sp. CA6]MCH7343510.1 DUF3857 domain-containing protein [Pelomonas sp. CA6]
MHQPTGTAARQRVRASLVLLAASCAAALTMATTALAATATQATQSAAVPKAAARATSAAPSAAAPGFQVAAAPGWVRPQEVDPALPVPAGAVQVLLLDRQTRVDPAGSQRYRRNVRRISEAAGLQRGGQIEIEFDPAYQTLTLHHLDLWRDGKRINRLDRRQVKLLHREPQLERQIIDGRMTASIVLEDLRVGDRLDWAYTLSGDNPVFEGRFVDQEWMSSSLGPVGLARLRLLAPSERKLHHRTRQADTEVSERVDGRWRETVFQRRGAAQFNFDPLLPMAETFRDQISISEFASWAEVAAWADQLFARAAKGTEALDPVARDIEQQASSPEDRLRRALDFVQQDIRYFGTEIGINSHQPASVDTVLRQRFGDCKDKTALLVNLLARLGIPAQPVLVSTHLREAVADQLPSPLAFNHAIARVQGPVPGQVLWLDATRASQRGAPEGRQSLALGHGLVAVKTETSPTAMPSGEDVLRSETRDLLRFPRLAEAGELEAVSTYHGESAEWLRDARSALPPEDWQKIVTGEVWRAYPGMVADGTPQVEEVPERNALRITQRYKLPQFWRLQDMRLLAGDYALYALMSPLRLQDQTPRSQAMRLSARGRHAQTLRFEFGEETFSQPSSSRFDDSNPFYELNLAYTGEPRMQQIEGELRLRAEQVEAGQWNAYREQLLKTWPRLGNTMRLVPMAPAELAALRKAMEEQTEQMRRGSVKALTRDQVNARLDLLVAQHSLKAGRLPPKVRAQVLTQAAIQLDHLGEAQQALALLQQALALNAEDPDLHGALAVNALLRGQDGESVTHAERALQLAPGNTSVRYTRAWARYFAGQYAQSRDELRELLRSRSEVERGYGGIWLYLSARQLGEDGKEAVRAFQPSASKPAWPAPVLRLMQGELDLEAALKLAREDKVKALGQECELYFYAGQKALLDKDLALARRYLQKAVDTGVVEFNEHAMARRTLERLDAAR